MHRQGGKARKPNCAGANQRPARLAASTRSILPSGSVFTTSARVSQPLRAAPMPNQRYCKSRGVMRVGIDRALHAFLLGQRPPAPVHVEPARIAVQLDDRAGLGGGLDDRGDIDGIAFARKQQPPGEMAEHGDVRIFDRADDAPRHLRLRQIEDGVHAGHAVVELRRALHRGNRACRP